MIGKKIVFGELFAGIGGLGLGLERSGFSCLWMVEINKFSRNILSKHWPNVKKYDDITKFIPTKEDCKIDLLCGGFPCQDLSVGRNSDGIGPRGLDGEKSSLWFQFSRIIGCIQPRWVVIENVGALSIRGLNRILWKLASQGYDAEWAIISAGALGAPHLRKRIFIVALQNSFSSGLEGQIGKILAQPKDGGQDSDLTRSDWWSSEPNISRVADGIPFGMDGTRIRRQKFTKERIMCLGNSVVPIIGELIGRRIQRANSEIINGKDI